MSVSQYPLVLAERLDETGYAALVEMADDREARLTGAIDERFTVFEHRMDQRFAVIDQQMAVFDQKLETQTEKIEHRLADEFGRVRVDIGGLRTEMVQQRADLMKWAMVFWISQAAAIAGIVSVLR